MLGQLQAVRYISKDCFNEMAQANGRASVCAVLISGCDGMYYNWSKNQMRHCISDFLFRFVEGKVRNHGMARLKRIFEQR